MTKLNLSRNQLTDKGAASLAEFLTIHYYLKVVKVNWNKIGTKGGIALAEALKENGRILVFDGSFNQFG